MRRSFLGSICAAGALAQAFLPMAQADTSVTLDGTSGDMVDSSTYSTTGNLNVYLGFFVEYLVAGGGGGNGSGQTNVVYASGGGGGQVLQSGSSSYQIDAQSYALSVGAGGTNGGNGNGTSGSSSSIFGLTALGGTASTMANQGVGGTSGSGYAGGSANQLGSSAAGGGGGGDAGAGGNGTGTGGTRKGGTGGLGTYSDITGTSLMYGFGGGGGAPGSNANYQNGDGTTGASRANSGGGAGGSGTGAAAAGTVVVRYKGTEAATGGTISTGTGTAAGYTIHSFTSAGASALSFSSLDMDQRLGTTATGIISGTGDFVFSGPGRLTLTGSNTYSGRTVVAAGKLYINGDQSAATNTVTVESGALLGGSGKIGGATTVQSGGTISPGNSPGNLTINDNVILQGGGNYNWQVTNAAGSAGIDWDLISSGGVLDLTGITSSNPFNINLWSLSSINPDVNGDASNFNTNQDGRWTILVASEGMLGFSADKFALNVTSLNGTGGFSNSLNGGTFSVEQNGNNVDLVFTSAVPEPGTMGLVAAGGLFLLAAARKGMRRRPVNG